MARKRKTGITARQKSARRKNMAVARKSKKKGGKKGKIKLETVTKKSALFKTVAKVKKSYGKPKRKKFNKKKYMESLKSIDRMRKKQGW